MLRNVAFDVRQIFKKGLFKLHIRLTEVMIGQLLNGLGVVKRSQDGEANDRLRKTAMTEFARSATKNVENEYDDRLIVTILGTMCNGLQF